MSKSTKTISAKSGEGGNIQLANKNLYIELVLPAELRIELAAINKYLAEHIPAYNPMAFDGFHMTVAYIGDIAQYAKSANKSVKVLLAELQLLVDEFNKEPLTSLRFSGYDLFSEKRNLIVARYTISHPDYIRILDLKKTCATKYGAPAESDYEPHITMGKIQNCNDANRPNLVALNIPRLETAIINPDADEPIVSGIIKLAL